MKNIDRRSWLKTMGMTGSLALLSGLETFAIDVPTRNIEKGSPVKLNANENPFGPSNMVRSTINASMDDACRYPFRTLAGLVRMIAEKEGVSKDHIVITGGSTEGLKASGLVFGGPGSEIVAADPTFQALLRYSETFGTHVHRVALNDKLEHDLEAMSRRITSKTSLVFICNPNNPSGTILPIDQVRDFCKSHDRQAVIFSDEAYYDFITEQDYPSMVELVKEDRNIIVSRTFSKVYGLAGLRVGYLIARPDIARRLKRAVMANTNILAIEAAKTALKDEEFYKFSVLKAAEAKQHIYKTLDELSLSYVKSHTNFVFFRTGRSIHDLIPAMQDQGVLIGRPFPPLYEWARISTGTMEEVKLFGTALRKVMT